jgi:hypothetical protein
MAVSFNWHSIFTDMKRISERLALRKELTGDGVQLAAACIRQEQRLDFREIFHFYLNNSYKAYRYHILYTLVLLNCALLHHGRTSSPSKKFLQHPGQKGLQSSRVQQRLQFHIVVHLRWRIIWL